ERADPERRQRPALRRPHRSAPGVGNDGQGDVRRMLAIDEDAVARDLRGSIADPPVAVRIDVEMREIAARHFDPDTVTRAEQVAGREGPDGEGMDLTGLHRLRVFE